MYAVVYAKHKGTGDDEHEVHPHHVIKVMRSSAKEASKDGTIMYLKSASKHADENPHFPRIHHIHSIESVDGSNHIVKLEKLHNWDSGDVSDHERVAAFVHAFHHEPPSHILDYAHTHDRTHYLGRHIQDKLISWNHEADLPRFSHIAHAMEKIRNITKKARGHVGLDLHQGNFMIRKTPVGSQLVLTDPVVGSALTRSRS